MEDGVRRGLAGCCVRSYGPYIGRLSAKPLLLRDAFGASREERIAAFGLEGGPSPMEVRKQS